MILQKFFQPLLAIIGERPGRIQLIAVQLLMATGSPESLKMLFASVAIFTHEKVHSDEDTLMQGQISIQSFRDLLCDFFTFKHPVAHTFYP